MSERRACRTLGQHRSTQRKVPRGRPDEARLTADIIELARQYGRYGYRPITALLKQSGWQVNLKRVERIWRREGLVELQMRNNGKPRVEAEIDLDDAAATFDYYAGLAEGIDAARTRRSRMRAACIAGECGTSRWGRSG